MVGQQKDCTAAGAACQMHYMADNQREAVAADNQREAVAADNQREAVAADNQKGGVVHTRRTAVVGPLAGHNQLEAVKGYSAGHN
jgi:hypothetical protein